MATEVKTNGGVLITRRLNTNFTDLRNGEEEPILQSLEQIHKVIGCKRETVKKYLTMKGKELKSFLRFKCKRMKL